MMYVYKASLIGSAHRFELMEDGLSWHVGGKSGVWHYPDIAAIRLSYRPVSMQSRRFRADIRHVNGQRVSVLSTTWQTVTLMTPQDKDYRALIIELHRRLEGAGAGGVLVGGVETGLYAAGGAGVAVGGVAIPRP